MRCATKTCRHRAAVRPASALLEALESRLLLSTFVTTEVTASAASALVAAVDTYKYRTDSFAGDATTTYGKSYTNPTLSDAQTFFNRFHSLFSPYTPPTPTPTPTPEPEPTPTPQVTIGSLVWNDANANGIQDSGETGLSGVTIKLYNGSTLVTSTTTASDGSYLFTQDAGTYTVTVDTATLPSGYFASPTLQGSNTALDANTNPSSSITLTSGTNDLTVDFGFFQKVTIGNFVWNDANANGIQDAGEAGLSGVTVKLYNGSTLVTSTTTAANGSYLFTANPGTYTVTVVLPTGYTASPTLQGSNTALDANTTPSASVTLAGGASDLTVDFGFFQTPKVTIGSLVWNDANANGIQDSGETGLSGVIVKLYSGSTLVTSTTTASDGSYLFTQDAGTYTVTVDTSTLPSGYFASPTLQGSNTALDSNTNPSASITLASGANDLTIDFGFFQKVTIGNFVWNDANANGIQDSGEAGLSGVTVKLYNGSTLVTSTTTASNGSYLFTANPGTYTVTVDTSTLPAGYFASPTLQGSNTTLDSNTNPSSAITLSGGASNLTVDFGFFQKVTIGNFVWNDANANGIQDTGEAGLSGVTVRLYNGSTLVTSTTTASNGSYLFTANPGTYTVTVVLPTGYTASPTLQGSNTALDANTNPSASITLSGGASNLTVDFGFFQTPTPTPSPLSITQSTLGNLTRLTITGTTDNDSIIVSQSGTTLTIIGNSITSTVTGTFGEIVIYGGDGNDTIIVQSSVNITSLLYGGNGSNTITVQTTTKSFVVTLGAGTDTLTGNANTSFWADAADTITGSTATNTHRVTSFYQPFSSTPGTTDYITTTLNSPTLRDPTDSGTTTRLSRSLWSTGPVMTDINQGQVGDCYFLASLQSLAGKQPALLQNMAVDLGDGTYAVQFVSSGVTTFVRVDGDLPGSGTSLRYARPASGGAIWAAIIEKAYAFFRSGSNSYDSLNWGWTGSALSDLGVTNTTFNTSSSTIFNTLTTALANNKAVAAVTNGTIASGIPIISGHAYSVVSTSTVSGVQYITVRNPWGIDGAGSDSNPYDGLVTITLAQFQSAFAAGSIQV